MFRGDIKSHSESMVTAHYSCTSCKLSGIDIEVPAKGDDQGHMDWAVKVIYPIAMEDHRRRSPDCEERFLDIGVRAPGYVPVIEHG